MKNGLVTFENTCIKPYHYYTKETNISYLETTNDLTEKLVNKLANKEIPTPLNYLKP